ncbi:hypothetical protein [Paenibacillus sp. L3-i20]|uniref:hypothetical protein n=1 Tax=Paenibacillus sp. L3-i20 TaxID=2905833 RepID=UPI001EDF1C71|nr:hypothetical protein [Paenibacillus sp. L3-i20]GKU80426.1 hypothetical protein L3i20_v248230 [Paenibacillus sp. L3-i20]
MRELREQRVKRRFKTGHMVQYDGLYCDDWGDDLLLIRGDLFPTHPQMGETNWTYAGPAVLHVARSPKLNGQFIGY